MSLATTGGMAGGGGMGGLTLAHQANALGAAAPKAPPPPNASFEASGTPSLSAVLGEGLLDKNQQLSAKQVKNVAHLPLVGVDLHAGLVSYFPPKPEDPSKGALPVLVGRMKTDVCLKQGETSHKTLRKWLAKSKPFAALQEDSLTTPNSNEKVLLSKPYHLLGLRRQEDAPATKLPFVEDGPAIAEESSEPVVLSVSTLDGSPPTGDDHDRLVYKVKLHSSKKALTVFPEEATQILVDQARQHVVTKSPIDDPEEVGDLPVAVALPAWALHDAAVEALSDASGAGCVFFQRSVCALAGTLLHPGGDKPHPLLERLFAVRKAMQKEFQQEQAKDSAAVFNEDVMVLLMGCTDEGVECTAVQVSAVQDNVCCLFGNYNVISSVSYKSDDPVSMLEKCTKELEASIDSLAPDADGPAGVLFYGTHIDQLKSKWSSIKSKQAEWESLPLFQSKTDAVVMGASVLGGVSHGRASVLVQKGKKMRPELGIRVQNVAPVAVGVQINYFGGAKGKWEEVKPIFDFDRRIPAGPYSIDLKASECVVHREGSGNLDDEAFLKASKDHEGSKGIPKREEAALDLRVQVVQRWTRDGDWKKVGNPLEPLVKTDRDEKRIAIEETTLVLSYGVSGMVSVEMQGDRESVSQATVTARNSMLRYYFGIAFAILFFGGFLFKSYWEDHVLERDTKRLLLFYKFALPGSIHDGDEHSARYIAWKYRGKKEKLWKSLEKKYGEPVLTTAEYEEMVANQDTESNDEGEAVDLDEEAKPVDEETNDPSVDDEPDL